MKVTRRGFIEGLFAAVAAFALSSVTKEDQQEDTVFFDEPDDGLVKICDTPASYIPSIVPSGCVIIETGSGELWISDDFYTYQPTWTEVKQ